MSGLSHHPGKVAQGQLCRGFESLSLRQEVMFYTHAFRCQPKSPHHAGVRASLQFSNFSSILILRFFNQIYQDFSNRNNPPRMCVFVNIQANKKRLMRFIQWFDVILTYRKPNTCLYSFQSIGNVRLRISLSEVSIGGCLPSSMSRTRPGAKKASNINLETCEDDSFSC